MASSLSQKDENIYELHDVLNTEGQQIYEGRWK